MPVLDLGYIPLKDLTGPLRPDPVVLIAGVRLFAYMHWPHDEDRRNNYLATVAALALATVGESRPPQPPRWRRSIHQFERRKTG